jgi:hypothetical protein
MHIYEIRVYQVFIISFECENEQRICNNFTKLSLLSNNHNK